MNGLSVCFRSHSKKRVLSVYYTISLERIAQQMSESGQIDGAASSLPGGTEDAGYLWRIQPPHSIRHRVPPAFLVSPSRQCGEFVSLPAGTDTHGGGTDPVKQSCCTGGGRDIEIGIRDNGLQYARGIRRGDGCNDLNALASTDLRPSHLPKQGKGQGRRAKPNTTHVSSPLFVTVMRR
jgi:hypothetical protein